jgi:hypothetical protein
VSSKIELDVAGVVILMVGIPMEAKHEVSLRFDPVDAVVFVIDTGWIPEANVQSRTLDIVGVTQKRRRRDICNHVSRPLSRRTKAYVLTAGLDLQSVMYVSKEGTLRISIATSEKEHLTCASRD